MKAIFLGVIGVMGAACAMQPIPVEGPRSEVERLEGQWIGAFSSTETDRHGDISFELAADADTARGYVYMIPHVGHEAGPVRMEPMGDTWMDPPAGYGLAIEFVAVAEGRVYGVLSEYRDPDDGCRLETRFEGTIDGDRIEGYYITRHVEDGVVHRGGWLVRRRLD